MSSVPVGDSTSEIRHRVIGMGETPRVDSRVDAQYQRIRSEIVDRTLPPGTLLLETALSQRYGVSRTPVREALARLAQEGLLDKAVRGYRVRVRSPQELIDVFDARIALESAAARLAAERRTPDDLARLAILVESRAAEPELAEQDQLNARWHLAVIDAAHNPTIADMLQQTRTLLAIYRPLYTSTRSPGSAAAELAEHQEMTRAIEQRDGLAAQTLMATHLTRGRDARVRSLLTSPESSSS